MNPVLGHKISGVNTNNKYTIMRAMNFRKTPGFTFMYPQTYMRVGRN